MVLENYHVPVTYLTLQNLVDSDDSASHLFTIFSADRLPARLFLTFLRDTRKALTIRRFARTAEILWFLRKGYNCAIAKRSTTSPLSQESFTTRICSVTEFG